MALVPYHGLPKTVRRPYLTVLRTHCERVCYMPLYLTAAFLKNGLSLLQYALVPYRGLPETLRRTDSDLAPLLGLPKTEDLCLFPYALVPYCGLPMFLVRSKEGLRKAAVRYKGMWEQIFVRSQEGRGTVHGRVSSSGRPR